MLGKLTIVAAAALAAAIVGGARAAARPPWFAPIAAYYHHNPKITPSYDFASLYSGRGWPQKRGGAR